MIMTKKSKPIVIITGASGNIGAALTNALKNNYKFVVDWYGRVGSRPAVIKGYDCLNTGEKIPKI